MLKTESNKSFLSGVADYVLNNALKTAACIISCSGAFLVASTDYVVQLLGFEMWIGSNLAWIFVGVTEKDYPVMVTFGVYFCFNILGVMNRWGMC